MMVNKNSTQIDKRTLKSRISSTLVSVLLFFSVGSIHLTPAQQILSLPKGPLNTTFVKPTDEFV